MIFWERVCRPRFQCNTTCWVLIVSGVGPPWNKKKVKYYENHSSLLRWKRVAHYWPWFATMTYRWMFFHSGKSEMTTKSMCTFSAIRSTFKFFFRMDTHRYKLNYYINESCATCVQNYNLALLFH